MDEAALIAELYASVTSPETWPQALEKLARATGAEGTLVLPMQGGFDVAPIWSPSMDEGVAEYVTDGWWERDTRIRQAQALRMGEGVYSDVEFIDRETIRRDPFYQDFLARRGFGTMLCRLVGVSRGPLVSISVQRRRREGLFEAAETERFIRLSDHASRALAAGISLAQARTDAAVQRLAREHRAHGYALLSETGRVTYADDVVSGLFGSVFTLDQGRLGLSARHRTSAFDRALSGVLKGEQRSRAPQPFSLSRSGLRRDLIVRIVPVVSPEQTGFEAMAGSPRAMVIVHDLSADERKDVHDLLMAVGLTPAQARVVETMAAGLSAREAAVALALSPETVRTTLRLAHERLHYSKQTQLAALVATLRSVA